MGIPNETVTPKQKISTEERVKKLNDLFKAKMVFLFTEKFLFACFTVLIIYLIIFAKGCKVLSQDQ